LQNKKLTTGILKNITSYNESTTLDPRVPKAMIINLKFQARQPVMSIASPTLRG